MIDRARQVVRYCECCGQPVDGFDVPLEVNGVRIQDWELSYMGKTVKLTLAGTALLFRTLVLRGRTSKEAFASVKFSSCERDQTNVYAHFLRRALKALGTPLEVRTVFAWGYELRDGSGRLIAPMARVAEESMTTHSIGQETRYHRRPTRAARPVAADPC